MGRAATRARKRAGKAAANEGSSTPPAAATPPTPEKIPIPFYDRSFADHQFTPERIYDEVQWLLRRALNTREVVGIIGSGVSSALGRPTWSRLIDEVEDDMILDPSAATESLVPVIAAIKAVKDASLRGPSDPDLLPLRAQLLRNAAQMLIRSGQNVFRTTLRAEDNEETSDAVQEDVVQRKIKEMTADDDFVAKAIWNSFIEIKPKHPHPLHFWRALDTLDVLVCMLRTLHAACATRKMTGVGRRLHAALGELRSAADNRNQAREDEPRRLCADERMLIPLLMAATYALGLQDEVVAAIRKEALRLETGHKEFLGGKNAQNAHRSAAYDPIQIIVEKLEIRRLLTTNYDFELELGLERLGFYPATPQPGSSRQDYENALGERASAIVFKKETSADLANFAVHAHPHKYAVFHLHGRACPGPSERLVITEPDYQAIYMRDAPEARVMNEALTAVMAGNPLLFIGMGMQEGDFLRPLRQFLAGPGPRINRCVVALLPTEESADRRAATALKLHSRYGVHTVYYGWPKSAKEADKHSQEAPLFQAIDALRATKKSLLSRRRKTGDASRSFARAVAQAQLLLKDHGDEQLLWSSTELARLLFAAGVKSEAVAGALGVYLGEFDGRVRARALCNALEALSKDRLEWWTKWRELPRPRTFAHTIEEWSVDPKDGELKWRCDQPRTHQAYLNPSGPPVRNIRYRIRDFQPDEPGFRSALETEVGKLLDGAQSAEQRRIFVVHGDVGAGRGSLFHVMADKFVEPQTGYRLPYAWGVCTNATFSTEYSSVVDGVIHFLWRCGTSRAQQYLGSRAPPPPLRRDAVRALLNDVAPAAGRRGLFVIGGADLLFRSDHGDPKNAEIVDALGALLEDGSEKHAIDVVLICRSDHCRAIFGTNFEADASGKPNMVAHFGRRRTVQGDVVAESPRAPTFTVNKATRLPCQDLHLKHLGAEELRPDITQPLVRALRGRFSRAIVIQCAKETESRKDKVATRAFLSSLSDAHSKADATRSMDVTISAVLKQYSWLYQRDSTIHPELLELILKHVAIMSGPVELAVLARCPAIHRKLETWLNSRNTKRRNAKSRNEQCVQALKDHLERLVTHQLIFRIRERDEFRDESEPEFKRYAAHQSLQAFFFHQMGAPFLELGDARLFVVSLYASQGTRLPSPTVGAFKFLIELIRELIGYPRPDRPKQQIRSTRERAADVCALRAAVSLARSAFSFAVVSRFAEFDQAPGDPPRHYGYLEEYRLLLRWMIFRAGKLGGEPVIGIEDEEDERVRAIRAGLSEDDGKCLDKADLHKKYRLNPLYQDEITWLYNECAVVSLAQGNLYDAVALLDQAEISNGAVEAGDPIGPNALRIQLNKALANIERGNLKRANETLRRVWEASRDEPVVNAVADGYIGLAAHLRGRFNQAEEHYKRAITVLRHLGEGRAIAIFSKHYADLLRPRDPEGAKEKLSDAVAEAETARQYDLVHRIYISMALTELETDAFSAEMVSRVLRRTEFVLRYAEHMEIYSLKAEALLVRSIIMHRQGETQAAGDEAVQALSLANLHGQRIRAIFALMRLGDVLSKRTGYEDQGERLLRAAGKMADRYESQLNRQRVDERLLSHPQDVG